MGRGKEEEFGISRCKLVYITWIDNQVLLHRTGNHIQYWDNRNGKEDDEVCVYN